MVVDQIFTHIRERHPPLVCSGFATVGRDRLRVLPQSRHTRYELRSLLEPCFSLGCAYAILEMVLEHCIETKINVQYSFEKVEIIN